LLPQAFGKAKTQLISREEGVGKVKAALDARRDPALVIMGRTGAAGVTDIQDAIVRAKAFEATGVDALFFTGIKTRADLEAVTAATSLPIVLGGPTDEMTDWDFLSGQRVKIAIQGHAPIAAATQAVQATLKAIREGAGPKGLKNLASAELMKQVTRADGVAQRQSDFLGLKRP
jgi:carboxyvinyl-carboxyphosphonate phosphorylmutase